MNSASPEIRAAGVSFRVDTGTLGTLPLLPGKTCEELFFLNQTDPVENPSFSFRLCFLF